MPETVGYITFNNAAAAYTIGTPGSSNLTLDNGSTAALITVNAGSHTIAENINSNSPLTVSTDSGTALTISGAINGSQGLSKVGLGTLTLTGQNFYSGGTIVGGGVLALNGGTLGSFGSAVTVNSGGTLDLGGAVARGRRRHDCRRHDSQRHPHGHVVRIDRRHGQPRSWTALVPILRRTPEP